MSVKLTARSAVTQANINKAKAIVLDQGATKAQLETAAKFLAKAQASLRMATGPLSREYPTVMNFRKSAEQRLASFVGGLEASTRTERFKGVTVPTTVDPALKDKANPMVSNGTRMAIQRRNGQGFIWTSPMPRPVMRAMTRSAGMVATDNRAGGKNLRAGGGKDIVGASQVTGTLDAILPKNDSRRARLEQAGIDLKATMDMMVIKVEGQKEPMVIIGGAGRADTMGGSRMMVPPWARQDREGVTVICSEVQFIPFKNQDGSPSGGGTIVMRKPVVYLYPQSVQSVKVELHVDGQLTTTYPRLGKDHAWTVKAGPTGELFDPQTEKRYPYLFWEAKRSSSFTIDTAQAFCVSHQGAERFLEDAADKFALNEKERTDFVTYWLPALENNKFSLVQFLSAAEYDRYATMTVTPKPDCVNRLFMIFQGVNSLVKTGSPALAQLDRKGFTVVEWGGSNLDEQR